MLLEGPQAGFGGGGPVPRSGGRLRSKGYRRRALCCLGHMESIKELLKTGLPSRGSSVWAHIQKGCTKDAFQDGQIASNSKLCSPPFSSLAMCSLSRCSREDCARCSPPEITGCCWFLLNSFGYASLENRRAASRARTPAICINCYHSIAKPVTLEIPRSAGGGRQLSVSAATMEW